ncbi:MAG: BCCT family transporter [Lachnospiraceae bacterium]|nr:BCCT family transporter [Lachnospiraceae bacterium]
MKKNVFYVSFTICLLVVIGGIFFPSQFEALANIAKHCVSNMFGWWYVIIMTLFVIFTIWIGWFSKYKNVRLGEDNSKPEYNFASWFAMLFSAGMGIGLVFWGTAEPLNFFVNPLGYEAGSPDAMRFALLKSFLHWGIHPWANYAVLSLALAYFWYRKKQSYLVSSILAPFLRKKEKNEVIRKTVDILAVFATIAGVSTSLGLGAMQIASGLNRIFSIPENNYTILFIVIIVTLAFMLSAVTGIDKGIKILSNINVLLCMIIALSCFLIGPTLKIISGMIESFGIYLQNFISGALEMGAFENKEWYSGWTIFYWAWWIAWAPFTGIFIARISKGRTIHEFCIGVTLVPALVSIIWFSIFGILGMDLGLDTAKKAIENTSTALFVCLEEYNFGSVISIAVIGLLCTFFVTSADSATYVTAMLTSDGQQNPSNKSKISWGLIISLTALSLILFTDNGLNMLQTISIVGAFPFSFVMLIAMISLIKALKNEKDYTKA